MERAEVILLPATEDRDIWAYFASLAFPPERDVRMALAALAAADGPQSLAALEAHVDLPRGRLETMLKVLDVDGAVRRVPGGWTATGQPWSYDIQRYDRVAAERSREQQAMLGYSGTDGCRMEYLRRELDDPEAGLCGRCDNCTGVARVAGVSGRTEELARDRLRRPGVTVTPRHLWPTGMAASGQLSYLGSLDYLNGGPPGRQYNSAQRLAALWRTLAVPEDLRAALAGFGHPVLLVDDRIGTGWTMTVGAKLLRECAAPAVLPLALATLT